MRPKREVKLTLVLDRDWRRDINVYSITKSGNIETLVAFEYTGYEAKMQVRKKADHADAILTLSTSDYSITLTSGLFSINLDRATINSSSLTEGTYVYDTILTDSDGSYEHISGEIEVYENITDVD